MPERGSIITVGHHDGRFIHRPGVYMFAAQLPDGRARTLFVGGADIAREAGPGNAIWGAAIGLGLSELVAIPENCPAARARLVRSLIEQLAPPLNGGAPGSFD